MSIIELNSVLEKQCNFVFSTHISLSYVTLLYICVNFVYQVKLRMCSPLFWVHFKHCYNCFLFFLYNIYM